ncbi:TPA: Cox family DNA-binding protein [Escherichia coli]|jgi:hypothetical protein|uniref:Cox family DNA-binding protein n=1 Tax=Escherichia coli TaxID=562 RepID=UPI00067EF021|nr:hypothetical protein [Escherichia coli]EEZ5240654.1 hypothetical protein [Escherichia coli]EFN3956284.1 hypothetical protein [Escherichia coli]EHA5606582.1 hypothetical protein [Escherichia coli]MCA6784409.1 regulatory phage cox family protein [Escherichia coli]
MEDSKVTTNVEISCPTSDEASFENEAKRKSIQISERPSDLLSKEGFALYIGKTPRAVAEMAKAGKLPAFYMTDPLKPRGKAELWVNRREWDKYAAQLVEEAPTEWHDWKNRISYSKSRHGRAA